MRWTIEGADKITGQEHVIQVEAGTREDAEQIASEQGMLVSGVYEPVNLTAAEQLEKIVADKFGPPRTHAPNRQTLDYRGPSTSDSAPASTVPEYSGITNGSNLLKRMAARTRTCGFAALILSALFPFVIIGVTALASTYQRDLISAFVISLPVTLSGIGVAIYLFERATLLALQAELAIATRDIARNSFAK